ncbi:3-hydroxyacyl-[acyl-carrier-protein] dehydratase [Chlorociboria aeruginascens]|nr:3-hydroxyacyl-[acyl-carrier-protein] dehydratase [Chlorociboria aeruginascens]
MRSSSIFVLSRYAFRPFHTPLSQRTIIRQSSTQALLHEELTGRPPNIIYDYLSPTPSHLLNISLADFLPQSCYPPNFQDANLSLPLARPEGMSTEDRHVLPQGHHLVYFSPQIPSSALLPDGTDPLQSPGGPFVRRMWAGGSLHFNPTRGYQLPLDNLRASCIERISDVVVKGTKGNEKVFVSIERRVGLVERYNPLSSLLERAVDDQQLLNRFHPTSDALGPASMVETRSLVFMREKSVVAAKDDAAKHGKVVKPPYRNDTDFDVRMTPTPSLLFRFSALTFNAHAIHLQPQYCREVEGHRDLLVHGPLSLVLMLSVLRAQLEPGEMVSQFDYRNLAPLYVNEEMRICVRKERNGTGRYEVWIEGKEGGYAVKGSAIIGQQGGQ